ncbi:hypothetical protein MLD38_006878 [Melastoma candidum]|uniref:Uncharacterized protein n=1 Tax=Melastoma candidum TaxID=119954 RepID=A0ACB9RQJ5_9MYRT|nr:hypothetical protein MLD38_006878 [Melastoma candidum]
MFVVAAVLLGLLGLFLLVPRGNSSGKGKVVQAKPRSAEVPKMYTKAEVALHNKRSDCWLILKDKIFDVTSYVEEHPGGDSILNNAGDDSTEGFYGPQHPGGVFQLVEDFYIGDLKK